MVNPIAVIVCGGRDGVPRTDKIPYIALSFFAEHVNAITHVFSGGARAVDDSRISYDEVGERWAYESELPYTVVPAKWTTSRPGQLNRGAGPQRNAVMLLLARTLVGQDVGVLAFPGGRGTADMVDRGKRASVPVWGWTGSAWVRM